MGAASTVAAWFRALITNNAVVGALSAWIVAQILKVIIELIRFHEVNLKRLFGDGGMPSGHSACVCGLATAIAMSDGFHSTSFAIAAVLAIVVMHDATSVRYESGKQARAINELRTALHPVYNSIQDDHLKELLGHNHLQVLFGAVLGIVTSLIVCAVFK